MTARPLCGSRPAAVLGLVGLLVLALLVPGAAAGLVWLAPVLLLVLVLSCGRYPGEAALLRVLAPARRERAHSIPRRPPDRPPSSRSRLLVGSLAGRAPPARLVVR
jgi:hypothetical protein